MAKLRQYDPASAGKKWSDVLSAPLTRERQNMRYQTLRPAHRVLTSMVENGELVTDSTDGKGKIRYTLSETSETPIQKEALRNAVAKVADARDSRNDLGEVLEELFGNLVSSKKRKVTFERLDVGYEDEAIAQPGKIADANVYVFPPLPALRKKLDETFAMGTGDE